MKTIVVEIVLSFAGHMPLARGGQHDLSCDLAEPFRRLLAHISPLQCMAQACYHAHPVGLSPSLLYNAPCD